METDKHSVKILLVEDDEGHAILIKDNLRRGRFINEVFEARDGQEALDFLCHRGPFGDAQQAPRPGLILLDIKLPRVDGLEVLRRIKDDSRLRTVPVIMLTTTGDQVEINKAYELGANGYVTKPVEYEAFQEKVKSLGLFLDIVSLPD